VVDRTAVVGPLVELGPGCEVGPHCVFEGRVVAGARNRFAAGVCIGGPPMDHRYAGEDTGVTIGSGNSFFEYATVHRATGAGSQTVIGDDNTVMTYVHVAHNCRVGSGCVLTSGVQLGGHVEVGDRANIGGQAGVHQYCRVGALAMVGAHSYVNKDIPPFLLAAGRPARVRGVNSVGLARAGFSAERVAAVKAAFRLLYRGGLNLAQARTKLETGLLPSLEAGRGREELLTMLEFFGSSRRGIELRTGPEGPEEE
jgi:UDP-N-acetylglucosamine acyltransferase